MAYQALYRAWRPNRFQDVVGQEPIITTLTHQIQTGHIAHAYLFCGSRGTGKTTPAKVLARAINCAHPLEGAEPCGQCPACQALAQENSMDVMEIDAASNNGVDEVRTLRDQIVYPPTVGRYKVYIIDEVHMLSTGAFNALLKTLEEPPAHAVFILATTEPQKLPATILSRCQRFDFKRISVPVIVGRLKEVLQGVNRQAEAEALQMIARAAEGGMRDALSLLDMCLAYGEGTLSAALVRQVLGTSDRAFLFDFAQALLERRARRPVLIHQMSRDGGDPVVFLKDIVSHFQGLLLSQLVRGRGVGRFAGDHPGGRGALSRPGPGGGPGRPDGAHGAVHGRRGGREMGFPAPDRGGIGCGAGLQSPGRGEPGRAAGAPGQAGKSRGPRGGFRAPGRPARPGQAPQGQAQGEARRPGGPGPGGSGRGGGKGSVGAGRDPGDRPASRGHRPGERAAIFAGIQGDQAALEFLSAGRCTIRCCRAPEKSN